MIIGLFLISVPRLLCIGNQIGDIGHAIQAYAESRGFSVVKDFTGHGIGPKIHEEPHIPHFGTPGKGLRLKEGMVITIEPMINEGSWLSKMDANGWTARTVMVNYQRSTNIL